MIELLISEESKSNASSASPTYMQAPGKLIFSRTLRFG